MREKPFERVPEPKLLVDDAMESFGKEGSGQAPALMGKPPRKNVKKAKTHAPAKRLSIDVPVFVQRRFKTACRATSRQMFTELRHLIETRMLELESEIGKPRAG